MKRKLLSVLLSATMVAALLVGCGAKEETAAPAATEEAAPAAEAEAPAAEEAAPATEEAAAEGQNLNIYCWNEEFKTRITCIRRQNALHLYSLCLCYRWRIFYAGWFYWHENCHELQCPHCPGRF